MLHCKTRCYKYAIIIFWSYVCSISYRVPGVRSDFIPCIILSNPDSSYIYLVPGTSCAFITTTTVLLKQLVVLASGILVKRGKQYKYRNICPPSHHVQNSIDAALRQNMPQDCSWYNPRIERKHCFFHHLPPRRLPPTLLLLLNPAFLHRCSCYCCFC